MQNSSAKMQTDKIQINAVRSKEGGMRIRHANLEELPRILEIYERARAFMRESGNPDQWGTVYPRQEEVRKDIQEENLYVCENDGGIVGVFFYRVMEDPSYAQIFEGSWMDASPYGVVHRIAADNKGAGVGSFCLEWAIARSGGHLRIDTHAQNLPMQRLLERMGFSRRGVIYVRDHSPRYAYEIK